MRETVQKALDKASTDYRGEQQGGGPGDDDDALMMLIPETPQNAKAMTRVDNEVRKKLKPMGISLGKDEGVVIEEFFVTEAMRLKLDAHEVHELIQMRAPTLDNQGIARIMYWVARAKTPYPPTRGQCHFHYSVSIMAMAGAICA